jgi:OmpA-OmpF porin, OOP family
VRVKALCFHRISRIVIAALGLGLVPQSVVAQTPDINTDNGGFALNRFDIAEVGSDWFAGDSLDLRGGARPGFRIGIDWAHKPLVQYDEDGDELDVLISDQVYGHLGLGLMLVDRLRLSVNLPILLSQSSDDVDINGVTFSANEGTAVGDLRISADVRLAGEYGDPITLALGVQLHAPTGDRDAFAGDGKVRFVPRLMIAGDISLFAYSVRVGFNYRPQDEGFGEIATGSELGFVATAGVRVADGMLLIGPELWGSTVVSDSEAAFTTESTPFELAFGAHLKVGGFMLGAGAGPGLNRGLGAPAVRVLGTIGYVPDASDRDKDGILDGDDACPDIPGPENDDPKLHGCPDRDHDKIIDPEDACPDVAGPPNSDPTKHGCPLPNDRDGDGIIDDEDACPDVPGVRNPDPEKNGCPPDRDGDGIIDDEDACPDVPGVRHPDPKKNGCPSDRDGDEIIDDEDACPDVPGPRNEDPAKNGCPLARVEEGQIKIMERIEFEFDSAKLVASSEPVLEAVLEILDEHPEITDVLVEGHTDNVGKPKYNKKLSDKRAAAVAKWLTDHGISADRMRSVGIGMDRPLASNDDEVGRQKNRRVEFHIKEDESLKKDADAAEGESSDSEENSKEEEEPAAKPEKKKPAAEETEREEEKEEEPAAKPEKKKKPAAEETDPLDDDPANW